MNKKVPIYTEESNKNTGKLYFFIFLVAILNLLFLIDLLTGSVKLSVSDLLSFINKSASENVKVLIIEFRLPRVLTALIAGMALSVSGLQMQTVFQNPLAGPYVLGISSGASLGVALLVLGISSFVSLNVSLAFNSWAVVTASWIGSGMVLLLILIVSVRVRDIMTILILGIMFASAVSAIVSILQYFSNESMLKSFVIWTMGSLGNLSWNQLSILTLSVVTGLLISVLSTKFLNAMLLGEDNAKSIGLRLRMSRLVIFASTSILAGSVTAFCGPLAFIGIAVPHISRLVLRTSSHKYLIPGSMILGGIALLGADIISQLPSGGKILPINSVTALIGIPVLIWIIIRRNRFIRLS